jgi:hypothetical protein
MVTQEIIDEIVKNGAGYELYDVSTGKYHPYSYCATNTFGTVIAPPFFELKHLRLTPAFMTWYNAAAEVNALIEKHLTPFKDHSDKPAWKLVTIIEDAHTEAGFVATKEFKNCLSRKIHFLWAMEKGYKS